jgi:hypothetical protein
MINVSHSPMRATPAAKLEERLEVLGEQRRRQSQARTVRGG